MDSNLLDNTQYHMDPLPQSYTLHWTDTHNIERTDQGTRVEKNAGNRRVRGDCRFCPCKGNHGKRTSRVTTYKCSECKVFLHPECFMAFHRQKFSLGRQASLSQI